MNGPPKARVFYLGDISALKAFGDNTFGLISTLDALGVYIHLQVYLLAIVINILWIFESSPISGWKATPSMFSCLAATITFPRVGC